MNRTLENRLSRLEGSGGAGSFWIASAAICFPDDPMPATDADAFMKIWQCISDGRGGELADQLMRQTDGE
jgi:hypothetical protein